MKSDMTLRQDVIDELEWDPAVNGTEIGVEVKDGVVTLTGHVKSFAEKYEAEKTAQRISGVRAVASEIDVRLQGDARRTDAEVAEAAINALAWNSSIPRGTIKVMVSDGFVTLSGQVDWGYQRLNAERTVRYLHGVRGVGNNIAVKTRATPANIKAKIESALQRQAMHEANHISFELNNGQVVLQGKVHSLAEKWAAEGAVWSAPGVTSVIDCLTVV